ncbi:MAG TPA: type II toxin-antitoxin system VapC family toxin [Pirellulaceae bacterium]|jgi:predicted nucleic acid-binding protein
MKGYLLDTNHVSKAVRRDSPLHERIYREKQRGLRVGTCVPVLCEIESGRLNVADPIAYRKGLAKLLTKILLWPLTETTAEHFGEIDQDLRRRGRLLSQVDIMLAALCRELDLALVTTDKDFAALTWLNTENWL